jgi:hypothetical protein
MKLTAKKLLITQLIAQNHPPTRHAQVRRTPAYSDPRSYTHVLCVSPKGLTLPMIPPASITSLAMFIQPYQDIR